MSQDKPVKEAMVSEFLVPVDRRGGYITAFVCSLEKGDEFVEIPDGDSFDHHLVFRIHVLARTFTDTCMI